MTADVHFNISSAQQVKTANGGNLKFLFFYFFQCSNGLKVGNLEGKTSHFGSVHAHFHWTASSLIYYQIFFQPAVNPSARDLPFRSVTLADFSSLCILHISPAGVGAVLRRCACVTLLRSPLLPGFGSGFACSCGWPAGSLALDACCWLQLPTDASFQPAWVIQLYAVCIAIVPNRCRLQAVVFRGAGFGES